MSPSALAPSATPQKATPWRKAGASALARHGRARVEAPPPCLARWVAHTIACGAPRAGVCDGGGSNIGVPGRGGGGGHAGQSSSTYNNVEKIRWQSPSRRLGPPHAHPPKQASPLVAAHDFHVLPALPDHHHRVDKMVSASDANLEPPHEPPPQRNASRSGTRRAYGSRGLPTARRRTRGSLGGPHTSFARMGLGAAGGGSAEGVESSHHRACRVACGVRRATKDGRRGGTVVSLWRRHLTAHGVAHNNWSHAARVDGEMCGPVPREVLTGGTLSGKKLDRPSYDPPVWYFVAVTCKAPHSRSRWLLGMRRLLSCQQAGGRATEAQVVGPTRPRATLFLSRFLPLRRARPPKPCLPNM